MKDTINLSKLVAKVKQTVSKREKGNLRTFPKQQAEQKLNFLLIEEILHLAKTNCTILIEGCPNLEC